MSVPLGSVPEELSLSFTGRNKKAAAANNNNNGNNNSRRETDTVPEEEGETSVVDQQIIIRAEVEAIITKVLPEEIDRVDEMLAEYAGREDDLLRQLRRMEEMELLQRDDNDDDDNDNDGDANNNGGPADPDDFMTGDPDDYGNYAYEDYGGGGGGGSSIMPQRQQLQQLQQQQPLSSPTTTKRRNSETSSTSGFDMDGWQDDLDHQLDSSNGDDDNGNDNTGNDNTGSHPEDGNSRSHSLVSHARSNPQAGPTAEGGASPPERRRRSKTPPEELLGAEPSSSSRGILLLGESSHGNAEEEKKHDGNGSGGGGSSYPPPTLLAPRDEQQQKQRQRQQRQQQLNAVDEDENDVEEFAPGQTHPVRMVQTNSMRRLKLSALTAPSSTSLMDELNEEELENDSNNSRTSTGSSSAISNAPTNPSQTLSGRKTVAMVKLSLYDPANPRERIKCMTALKIVIPNRGELEEAYYSARHDDQEAKGIEKTAASSQLRSEEDGESGRQITTASFRRNRSVKRLSIVKEEPDKPVERGDSYFDINDGKDATNNIRAKNTSSPLEYDEEMDNDEAEAEADAGKAYNPWEETREELRVGTLVGMQQNQGSSGSYASSFTSPLRQHQSIEWNVGNAINVHSVDVLQMGQWSELHRRMENHYGGLRELVLDGLPPDCLAMDEAELLFEALGSNRSVKKMSMRFSNVEDGLASLFALALVDNACMTQLLLEGNDMTNVSAKNFYSVLKTNNGTLRLLDLTSNDGIDEDVQQALDQFMEQRALKRTLTNKAEKAKRAAKGLPADSALEEEDDDLGDGRVTVVRPPNDDWENGEADNDDDEHLLEQEDDVESGVIKPYPGEHFRDYMDRMDQMKEETNRSHEHNNRLMNESDHEREAFDNYRSSGKFSDAQSSKYGYKQHQEEEVDAEQSLGKNPLSASQEGSTGSSITTRSTHKQAGDEKEIVTTASSNEPIFQKKNSTGSNNNTKAVKFAESTKRAPPKHMNSLETQESDRNQWKRNSYETLQTEASDEFIDDLYQSFATETSAAPGRPGLSDPPPAAAVAASDGWSNSPHPYHNTRNSRVSQTSLEISEEDYVDEKADERALRNRLATSGHAIGAYHIDEAAPARQNRGSGAGAAAGRGRGRRGVGRSESQRQARLAALEGGDQDVEAAALAGVENPGPSEPMYEALVRADRSVDGLQRHMSSKLGLIGLDDEDGQTDRMVCAILAVLLVALLVMIVFYAMRDKK